MKSIGLNEEGILLGDLEGKTSQPTKEEMYCLGKVYKDSCTLKDAEPTVVSCECEEFDEPEDEMSIAGATTLEFETTEQDPEACYRVWGGVLSADKREWDAPEVLASKEVCVQFTSRTGIQTNIGRGRLKSWRDGKQSKTEYARIKHRLTVLKPKIAGVAKYRVINTNIAPTSGVTVTTGDPVEFPSTAKAATRTVALSNGDKGWTVAKSDASVDWLTVVKVGEKVSYEVTANTGAARTTTVLITSGVTAKSVTINQAGV